MSAQSEANQAALEFACHSAAQLALLADPEAPITVPPYSSPPGTSVFYNGPQNCVVSCVDGSTTGFTTPPGRFVGANQAQADALAASYACQQAQNNKLCLSGLPLECCLQQPFTATINATGGLGTGTWVQTGGTLPPGLTAVGTNRNLVISGTPTTIGDYTFDFKCTLSSGVSRTKTFTLLVMGITDTSLPGFSQNIPYSFQLTAVGGTGSYTFGLVAGALPAGLHISSTGLISGTPIVPFDVYPVGIAVSDGVVVCRRDLEFSDVCIPSVTPALETAFVNNFFQAAYANVTGKVWCINSSTLSDILEVNPTSGAILHSVPIVTAQISCLFYENTNQLLYIAYNVAGDIWLSSVDPVTRAITNSVNTGSNFASHSPRVATFDPTRNRVWFGGQDEVFVLEVSGFTVSSPNAAPHVFSGGLCYCSGSDVVIAMGNINFTNNSAVIQVDPQTLATNAVDINADNGNTFGAVYSPQDNRVYAPSAPGTKCFVINPSSPDGTNFITVAAQPIGGVYNSCTNRVQILIVSAGFVVCDYINPDTNVVTAHVVTGNTYPAFVDPANMVFDSDNARVWFGSKTALLKFT